MWQDNLCKFDLTYWIIRDNEEDGVIASSDGLLQFDISCKQLEAGEQSKRFGDIVSIVETRCQRLLTRLSKKHGLTYAEILDVVAHSMEDNCVNVDTLETDDQREERMARQQHKNMTFLDKYSEKL